MTGSDAKVVYVPPGLVDREWPVAGPLLDLARRRFSSKMDLNDLYRDLKSGEQQLWIVLSGKDMKAAMTTLVEPHPKCSVLRVMLLGGRDMRLWRDSALHVIKDAARQLGCKTIEVNARLGWAKHAGKYGFKETARIYELEI